MSLTVESQPYLYGQRYGRETIRGDFGVPLYISRTPLSRIQTHTQGTSYKNVLCFVFVFVFVCEGVCACAGGGGGCLCI
jgi:hypothetical protein